MAETLTITRTEPPQWLLTLFDDIDSKRFGVGFDVLAEDVECHFGVNQWVGRDVVREKLREFDGEQTTKHHITEFWDGGAVKFFQGTIDVTDPGTGATSTALLTHIWRMSESDPATVARMTGSVGPLGNLGG